VIDRKPDLRGDVFAGRERVAVQLVADRGCDEAGVEAAGDADDGTDQADPAGDEDRRPAVGGASKARAAVPVRRPPPERRAVFSSMISLHFTSGSQARMLLRL
jgi:hypothetical protein